MNQKFFDPQEDGVVDTLEEVASTDITKKMTLAAKLIHQGINNEVANLNEDKNGRLGYLDKGMGVQLPEID